MDTFTDDKMAEFEDVSPKIKIIYDDDLPFDVIEVHVPESFNLSSMEKRTPNGNWNEFTIVYHHLERPR